MTGKCLAKIERPPRVSYNKNLWLKFRTKGVKALVYRRSLIGIYKLFVEQNQKMVNLNSSSNLFIYSAPI